MASLNEFGLQSTAIEEWLPWGGIIRPSIMRQKDGSMFSIITYDPYTTDLSSTLPLREFRRGWVMWNEHQHAVGSQAQDYLIIGWNPFETNGRIENALRPGVMAAGSVDYFDQEIHRFLADFQKLTAARLLEYQEIMDVLSFSLSMGEDRQEMPDCPLYMDALLSQNVDFEFGSNDVFINGKRICAVSLFAPDGANDLYQQLEHVTYRHVRRLLLFNKKQAKHDLLKYTSRWFRILHRYASLPAGRGTRRSFPSRASERIKSGRAPVYCGRVQLERGLLGEHPRAFPGQCVSAGHRLS